MHPKLFSVLHLSFIQNSQYSPFIQSNVCFSSWQKYIHSTHSMLFRAVHHVRLSFHLLECIGVLFWCICKIFRDDDKNSIGWVWEFGCCDKSESVIKRIHILMSHHFEEFPCPLMHSQFNQKTKWNFTSSLQCANKKATREEIFNWTRIGKFHFIYLWGGFAMKRSAGCSNEVFCVTNFGLIIFKFLMELRFLISWNKIHQKKFPLKI